MEMLRKQRTSLQPARSHLTFPVSSALTICSTTTSHLSLTVCSFHAASLGGVQLTMAYLGIPSPSSQYNSFELQFCKETFSANKAVLQKPLRYAEDSSARKTILSSSQLGNLDLKKIDQSAGGTLLYFEQGLIVGLASAAVTASACSYFAFQGFKDLLRSLRGLIGLLRYLSLDFGVL